MTKNIVSIPTVKEKNYSFDITSRLLSDRMVLAFDEVTSDTAQLLVSQLLYLDTVDSGDIQLIINSGGGSVHSGLATIDTMNYIKSDVVTIVAGLAASMGAMYLLSGTAGKRYALPNATIMLHAVSSGTRGTIHDQEISLAHTKQLNEKLMGMIACRTKMDIKKVKRLCERDAWLTAEQALELGVIDKIIESTGDVCKV
jgi:ATP-dependent Clp protease protease subunit